MPWISAAAFVLVLAVVVAGFLSPVALVWWEVGWGHRRNTRADSRKAKRKIPLRLRVLRFVIWMLGCAGFLGALAQRSWIAIGLVVLACISLAAWFLALIVEDVRGAGSVRRRFQQDQEPMTGDDWQLEPSPKVSAESDSPEQECKRKWWQSHAPRIQFTRFGIWR